MSDYLYTFQPIVLLRLKLMDDNEMEAGKRKELTVNKNRLPVYRYG
jgi:hypothetical protein